MKQIYDRLHVFTSTAGTGPYTVTGTATNRLSIDEALDAEGVTKIGAILELWVLPDDSAGSDDFEHGLYTYDGTSQLTRTSIIRSSNGNAAVNWGATQRNIVSGPSAELLRRLLDMVVAGVAGGSANAVEVSPNMPVAELRDNMIVEWTAGADNTADVTFKPTGIDPEPLRNPGAAATALVAGRVVSGRRYRSRWSAADEVWYLSDADMRPATDDEALAGELASAFISPATLKSVLTAWKAPPLLVNGLFQFNQRAPASNADGTYAHDRWYVLTQSGAIAVSTLTDVEDGLPFMARLTQSQATAQRFGYVQPVMGERCRQYRGKTVTLRFGRVRRSTASTVNYAVLEWTGTENALTRDVVNNWTAASLTAGNFFLGSNLTVAGTVSQALSANTLTDGTALTVTLSNSVNNLYVFAWTAATAAQNETFDLGLAQLNLGSKALPFDYLDPDIVLLDCQRHRWQSNIGTGTAGFPGFAGYNVAGAGTYFPVSIPRMHGTPTAGINGTWATSNTAGPTIAGISRDGLTILVTATGTGAFFTIPNSSDDYIYTEWEL